MVNAKRDPDCDGAALEIPVIAGDIDEGVALVRAAEAVYGPYHALEVADVCGNRYSDPARILGACGNGSFSWA